MAETLLPDTAKELLARKFHKHVLEDLDFKRNGCQTSVTRMKNLILIEMSRVAKRCNEMEIDSKSYPTNPMTSFWR